MSLFGKVFSKRNKALPDVYRYGDIPAPLRNQIVHIVQDAIGERYGRFRSSRMGPGDTVWVEIERNIAAEHGELALPRKPGDDAYTACRRYILNAELEKALDMIELCMRVIDGDVRRDHTHQQLDAKLGPDQAIALLNLRFREHGIGYQYESGEIIRVDSQYVHQEAVRPSLALLGVAGFDGPQQEFLEAHEHFRHGRYEEAITGAGKALESTMKAICEARGKDVSTGKTKDVIESTIRLAKLPSYIKTHIEALLNFRHNEGAHGAGAEPRDVPEHYAAHALHLTASNIVFLVKAHAAAGD